MSKAVVAGPIKTRYDDRYAEIVAGVVEWGLKDGKAQEEMAKNLAERFGISSEQAREDVALAANLIWLEMGGPKSLPAPQRPPGDVGLSLKKDGIPAWPGQDYQQELAREVKYGVRNRHTIKRIIADVKRKLNIPEAQAARDVETLLLTAVDQT